jgi:hypothetical protein
MSEATSGFCPPSIVICRCPEATPLGETAQAVPITCRTELAFPLSREDDRIWDARRWASGKSELLHLTNQMLSRVNFRSRGIAIFRVFNPEIGPLEPEAVG